MLAEELLEVRFADPAGCNLSVYLGYVCVVEFLHQQTSEMKHVPGPIGRQINVVMRLGVPNAFHRTSEQLTITLLNVLACSVTNGIKDNRWNSLVNGISIENSRKGFRNNCATDFITNLEESNVVEINFKTQTLTNITKNYTSSFIGFPPFIQQILEIGGLVPYIKHQLGNR